MTDKDLNLVKIYQKMSIFHLSLMYLVVGLLSIPFAAIYACLSILTDLRKAFLLPIGGVLLVIWFFTTNYIWGKMLRKWASKHEVS